MIRRLLVLLAVPCVLVVSTVSSSAGSEGLLDLQSMIDATAAEQTLRLPAGVYEGGVTIDVPMTLIGEPGVVIDARGDGNGIDVMAPNVRIEGVTVRNTGTSLDRENSGISVNAPGAEIVDNVLEDVLFGIFLREADGSLVAGNLVGAKQVDVARRGDGIRLWESHGATVQGNQVTDGRDVVLWFSDDLSIFDNHVSGGRYGLHFMYSDNAVVDGNQLTGNSVGAFLMYSRALVFTDNVLSQNHGPSGYGLGLKDMDGVTADGNRFVGNRVGVYLDNSPWSYDVYQHFTANLFAYNDIGVSFLPSVERNVFTENAFIDNAEQVGVQGGGTLTGNAWSVDGRGNYWSDFAGYDADGDGIGDIPYRLEELYSTLTDNHPELRFFGETPSAKAVSLAGEMFPVLRPRPKVEDPAPLIRVPTFDPVTSERGSARTMAFAALGMLAAAAIVMAVGHRTGRDRRELT